MGLFFVQVQHNACKVVLLRFVKRLLSSVGPIAVDLCYVARWSALQ